MKGLKSSALLGTLLFMGLSTPLIAAESSPVAAKIYFTDTDSAKWMVYRAHLGLAELDKKLQKLIHTTLKSLSGTRSTTERYELDLKFQANKPTVEKSINALRLWLPALNENHVVIDLHETADGRPLRFDLPQLNLNNLGLAEDDLTTIDHAQTAINHIVTAILKVDSLLPADTTSHTLDHFVMDERTVEAKANPVLLIGTRQGSEDVLNSLTGLHHDLIEDFLKRLQDIAERAVSSKNPARFDEEFQQYKRNWQLLLEIGRPIGNITVFNDNQLQFQIDDRVYDYAFPKLNLDVMNMKNDTILDFPDASATLSHLHQAVYWMHNWTVFGNTPYSFFDKPSTPVDGQS